MVQITLSLIVVKNLEIEKESICEMVKQSCTLFVVPITKIPKTTEEEYATKTRCQDWYTTLYNIAPVSSLLWAL